MAPSTAEIHEEEQCRRRLRAGTSYWKVKAAVKKSEGEVGSRTAALFKEVSLPAAELGGSEYTVLLRNGRELRIPEHFTENRVRQLVEILESC